MTSHTEKLTASQIEKLEGLLLARGYELARPDGMIFRAKRPGLTLSLYHSKKLLAQGKGTREFVEFILEPEILRRVSATTSEGAGGAEDAYFSVPRIGIDESGKGDFFGPLCVAGVYVSSKAADALRSAGIQDSKRIKSDRRMRELAAAIRKTRGVVYTTTPIGPEAYNRLYAKMGSVNRILAWGHARSIENLLQQANQMPEPVEMAIVDQFAATEKTVVDAMLWQGKRLKLVQKHKAESDLAVAAASILARCEFIDRLERLGESHSMKFPKGASKEVETVGRQFLERFGETELPKVCRCTSGLPFGFGVYPNRKRRSLGGIVAWGQKSHDFVIDDDQAFL